MRKLIDIPTTVTTVDMKTGKSTKSKTSMQMLPAKEGTCETCAVAHDPGQPHNPQSFFYQFRFNAEHKRSPTWKDAMAHCSLEIQSKWKELLKEKFNIVVGS